MDNFGLDVVAEGRASLLRALELAFAHNGAGGPVSHYAVREPFEGEKYPEGTHPANMVGKWRYGQEPKPRRLIFFWSKPESSQENVVALPFKLDAEGACDFAMRWLAEAEYGREPDHDGDNGKGWRAYVEGWGHVDGSHYAVVAISPAWACYGK